MGTPLRRSKPTYVAEMAVQPLMVHDFLAVRGKQLQLKRSKYWSRNGLTKAAHARNKHQVLGTERAEPLSTDDIFIELTEFTGPNDPNGNVSSLHVTKEDMIFARANLYEMGNLQNFHNSIGSENLADNYQSWSEAAILQELMGSTYKYNPGNTADNATYATEDAAKFSVVRDLLEVEKLLIRNNSQPFPDGLFHGLISPQMKKHIEADPDYRETQRSIIASGNVDPRMNGLIGQNTMMITPSGMAIASPMAPMYYSNFALWPSNVLGDLARTTTSSVTTPARTNIPAELGLFFGYGSVGKAVGGAGAQVIMEVGDYGRHFNFQWQWWGDYKMLTTTGAQSGIVVEGRTYAL
jgi:hypothetical protein